MKPRGSQRSENRPSPEQRRLLRKAKRAAAFDKAKLIASNLGDMTQAERSNIATVNPAKSMTRGRYVGGWTRVERGSMPHNPGGH